jgi:hypothetical protein
MYTSPPAHGYQILWRAGYKSLLAAVQADMTIVYTKKLYNTGSVLNMEGILTFTANQPCWLLCIFASLRPLLVWKCFVQSFMEIQLTSQTSIEDCALKMFYADFLW